MSWVRTPLSEVSETIDYGVTASAILGGGKAKFLRITDIQDNRVDWAFVPFCDAPDKKLKNAALDDGDIVFARTGATTGKSFLLKQPPRGAVFASYLIRVRPSKKVSPSYLAHFFDTSDYWRQIKSKAQGAAQEGVNASKLATLEIPLPPIDEQRRIAAILDRADELRQKRKKAVALLDSLIQSIFLKMFGDTAGLPVEELKDVVKKGTIVTYGIVQAGDEFDGGIPYIRTGDIKDDEISLDGLRHTDPAIAAKFSRSRVEVGEIVMSIRATVGTTALVPSTLGGANLTQGTARIAPGEKVTKEYLLHYLRSQPVQGWLERQVKGATFREITLGRLRELEVALPPLQLQSAFSRAIQAIERQKTQGKEALINSNYLFASLQHHAFSGQL